MRRILLAMAVASFPLAGLAAIPQTQRDALLTFYQSTHGDAWATHTGWSGAPGTECSWQGVTCDGTQSNVAAISLLNNNLAGPIPPEIGNLPNLGQLNLGANKLTGPLPASLSNSAGLQTLSLSNNQLSGPIPPELGRLAFLQVLNLDSNTFSGPIPVELGGLRALRRLDLRSNQLTGTIPAAIGNLATSLTAFLVSGNQLTGDVDVVLQLTKLQILALDGNQFTGEIPAGIGGLTSLQALSMGGNHFSGGIPATIGNLTNLLVMDFAGANLTGAIPSSIGQLTNLQFLTLSINRLTGAIPPGIGSLGKLQQLLLDRNSLSGAIPDSVANLKALVNFQAWNNALSGPIPSGIGQLTALQVLDLSSNRLTGSLPPSLTQLVNLQRLSLDNNSLSGSLPADIGNLKSLTDLRLNGDGLQGSLPPQIGNLRQLVTLSVYDNEFEGSIPVELGNLTALTSLRLGSNHFTGTIPKEIGALTRLTGIDVSLNALRGPVPIELENLTALADHASLFDHNMLATSDAALSAFLDRKQGNGGQWAVFQTVPPANPRVAAITDRSATIAWDRTLDLYSEGGYQVVASTSPGGAPVALATTPSKELSSIVIRGLAASTQYFFTVSTVTHPIGLQKNLLVSDPTPAVSTSTTARVLSPPDVAVSSSPQGLVQIDGIAVNQDSFTLTNYGDSATALTLAAGSGDFFSLTPLTFTLGAGESRTVTLTSIAKPAGSYYGFVNVQGPGAFLSVPVALLSVVRPAGTVNAVPVSTRVEVAGPAGSDIIGSAAFKNTGTAPLSGIVVADADWVQPSNVQVTIFPGATAAIPFTILASRRPPDLGALSANLRLVYVSGTSANGVVRALDSGASGVAVSIVTVVSTTKPPTSTVNTPALDTGELALFAPGLVSLLPNAPALSSTLSITNLSTATALSDLKVFFTSAGSTTSTVATFNPVGTGTSMSLVDVASNVFGSSGSTGSLQIRSASLANASAFATVSRLLAGTATIGDVPILRSDHSAKSGDVTVLTGVRGGADLYIQEMAGRATTVRVDFLDAGGNATVSPLNPSIEALSASSIAAVVPPDAVTAIVTNNGPGEIAAYARVTDPSGDTWSIVDWRRMGNVDGASAVRIPFVHGTTGSGRRRIVAHASTPADHTDVTVFNPGDDIAIARVDVLDANGAATSHDLTVASRQTLTFTVASPNTVGQLILTPVRGGIYATCRDSRLTASGTVGAAVPVVALASGLRLGQSRLFAGVEDSTSGSIAAAGPATYRSSLGLVETAGQSATIEISIAISETSSITSAFISQTIHLAPNQQLLLDSILRSILGAGRDSAFGDLHAMKVQIEVTSGNGAVLPFIVTTDNGSGDTHIRLE